MGELLLFAIDGHHYGVWKDRVISVEEVGAVHRLPFLRSNLTVLAVIGDHTRTLAELPQCLGHQADRGNGKASALVMSEEGQLRGFLLSADLSSQEAGEDGIVPLPGYLHIPFTEGFLSRDGELVPVVAVGALFEQILREGKPPQVHSRAVNNLPADEHLESVPFALVVAGGNRLAVRTPKAAPVPTGATISRFPLLPSDIDGVVAIENHLLPVVDLSRRVSQRSSAEDSHRLRVEVGGAAAVLLVDGTRGQWEPAETLVMDLPPICRKPWMHEAAVHRGQIAPIIDLATLLSSRQGTVDSEAATSSSTVNSIFPSLFGKENVEVYEVVAQGRRWALPKVEAIGIIDSIPTSALPSPSGIVAGIAHHDAELLPVLDLSRIMGSTESPAAAGKMILFSNGNFRALIPAETVPEVKLLKTGSQREVPVALPFPVVYGCYTEGEAVRLILNLRELALHFDQSRARDLLPPLSRFEEVQGEETVEPRPVGTQADNTIFKEAEATRPASVPGAVEEQITVSPPVADEPVMSEALAVPAANFGEEVGEAGRTEPELVRPQTETAPADAVVAAEEERLLLEETDFREQTIVDRPIHRGWRMMAAFLASAVLIVGAVLGLYFSGLVHEPQLPAAPQPAAQPQAPAGVPQLPSAQPNAELPVGTLYVVKEGDTLWDIANRLTGNPFNYHSIAGQNRIANPDLIFPGQTLRTPPDSRTSR